MSTIAIPLARPDLAWLSSVAENNGATVERYLRAKVKGLREQVQQRRSRAEIEAELRAQLSAIPLSEVDAPDPELDALSTAVVGEMPDDYRELLLEKYR
jgi:hypothetical protein